MFVVRKKLGRRGTFFSDVKRVFVDDVRQHHGFFDEILAFFGDFFHFFGGWEIMII